MWKLRRRLTLRERFWAKVDWSGGVDACWPWLGAKDGEGYGRLHLGIGRLVVAAHRVAYWLAHGGPVPRWLSVCHSCDHTWCVNPAHLWLGTALENAHDMMRKSRGVPAAPPGWEPILGMPSERRRERLRRRRMRRRAQHLGVTVFEHPVTL